MTATSGRLQQLDFLRGIAVLLVMARHISLPQEDPSAVLRFVNRGGWVGVDLFFVLSGFLVSGLLFREYQQTGTVRPGRFLIRRGFKIYPAFYVLTIPVLVVAASSVPRAALVGELLFVQNYLGGFWAHTWSLAVEEHFYLLLAASVWLLVKWRRTNPFRAIPVMAALVAVSCLALRIANTDQPYTHFTHLNPTHLRIDSLMFGVLLSYGWHFGHLQHQARQWRAPLLVAGAVLLSPAFIFPLGPTPWLHVYGLTAFYLSAGALLLGVISSDLPNAASVHVVARIGFFSYSIYLWHWPMRLLMSHLLFDVNWGLYAVAYLSASILIGIGAAKLIEGPSLRVRDRYFPSQSSSRLRAAHQGPSPQIAMQVGG